ncbi:hypothetical protein Q75_14790 [Bacillus coahuilensis p1.1.43]|uniref:Uncharacterized protein n=1 Tax=Bacillus coahuilensis p1.1.43 TaxID=1150625 RepID=A0A147K541_9BACI|nr:hypothetical protein Q75_14790 [Bacillus coahuilensis p1.1.43]
MTSNNIILKRFFTQSVFLKLINNQDVAVFSTCIKCYLSNIEGFGEQLDYIHPIRNKIAHGEGITFEKVKLLALDQQAFQYIS